MNLPPLHRLSLRVAPTAGFDDDRPIPREAMDRALKLLNPADLYKYMKHGLRWWKKNGATVSDAELYKLFQQLPKEAIKEAQILMDLDLSDELSPDFAVLGPLGSPWVPLGALGSPLGRVHMPFPLFSPQGLPMHPPQG